MAPESFRIQLVFCWSPSLLLLSPGYAAGPGLSHWRLWRAHMSVAGSLVPSLLTSLPHTLFSLLSPLFLAPPAVSHPGLLLQVACLISQLGGMDPAGKAPVPWHHCLPLHSQPSSSPVHPVTGPSHPRMGLGIQTAAQQHHWVGPILLLLSPLCPQTCRAQRTRQGGSPAFCRPRGHLASALVTRSLSGSRFLIRKCGWPRGCLPGGQPGAGTTRGPNNRPPGCPW